MDEKESGVKSPEIGFKRNSEFIMGFGVNGCPIWVFKGIAEPAKERYNDTYWVRLAELLIIENSYYNLIDSLRLKANIELTAFQEEQAKKQVPNVEVKKEEPRYMGSNKVK